jgi:hypothetical protein
MLLPAQHSLHALTPPCCKPFTEKRGETLLIVKIYETPHFRSHATNRTFTHDAQAEHHGLQACFFGHGHS